MVGERKGMGQADNTYMLCRLGIVNESTRCKRHVVAMVADFSKWKFNQWPFFPEKLSCSEGNGEKIRSF